MKDCALSRFARHSPFTKPQTFAINNRTRHRRSVSEYVMQRILFCLLLFIAAPSFALAAARVQTSGDPVIDRQWEVLAMSGNVGSRPVDPGSVAPTGIFRLFRGRSAPAEPRAQRMPAAAPQVRTTTRTPQIDRAFLPAMVDYVGSEKPGTVVIDTHQRYLYRVLEGGKAQRYGVGVGREGFGWSGHVRVGRKAEWPTWTPPAEMRKRQPYLPVSMAGGPNNPLGARALYLYDGGRDTLFRIHGSNEPWTIGHAVSSGCIRMRNEDVIELYSSVGIGTPVVVR
jgi:lipoprotein-anchoring transpeptidase ErfK/SrfK